MPLLMDGNNNISPEALINREKELALIQQAFDAFITKNNILSTPVINFFGIDGIGKTRILQEISVRCVANDLQYIKLDGSQTIRKISSAVLQQAKKYKQRSPAKRNHSHTSGDVIKELQEDRPVVILLDSIDASNDALVNWIKVTLRDLMEHDHLLVILMSKQKIIFENDWSMVRKLTTHQLKPLNLTDSISYLASLDNTMSPEIRETIFQWTRGYPLAMEIMAKAIFQKHFDIQKSEDQQKLINLIIEETIDKKVLAHVEDPSHLHWCKAHFRLLSIPRRFNLVIMQELLETFGSPPIKRLTSKLEYMGLPKQLNPNIDILHWDMQKSGFTIDESIRSIFLTDQQIHNASLFMSVNQYLVKRNWEIAQEVIDSGSDCIRYFLEYLYHSALCYNTQTVETNLQATLQKLRELSLDATLQFRHKFTHDEELQEILGKRHQSALSLISKHFAPKEEQA